MKDLAKLEEISDLREIWTHEATDFTPWLAEDDNIKLLSDTIGIDIEVEERESAVGSFNVDIFAREIGTGRNIIIENQLEDTNHDHLGKIITYASGKNAEIIIWIVKHAREEHISAIEWLNSHTDENIGIFLLEIKVYKIGNSKPAVKFEIIEKPNDWSKEIKKNKIGNRQIHEDRYTYWQAFNDYAFNNNNQIFSKDFKRRKPSTDHWLNYSIGSSAYHLVIRQLRQTKLLQVGLYIEDNKDIYKKLYNKKQDMEKELGLTLNWSELPERKATQIFYEKPVEFEDKSDWENQFEWLMDIMQKMRKVFLKYIKEI